MFFVFSKIKTPYFDNQLKKWGDFVAIKHSTRVKMEKYIYDVFDRLDPTKTNTNFYKAFFSKMTDKEFDDFFKDFFKDKDGYLIYNVELLQNEPKMKDIENAAKFMGVPLYEYVVQPYFSRDKNKPMVTPYPVPVGYILEKRVQQTAMKKNSTSIDISARDAKTNQVINQDKNAKESIDENYAMMTYGAKKAVKEFMSFRADDSIMKEEAYRQIREQGYVSMDDLPDNINNKRALRMLDAYMIGMGLKTDLVSPGYVMNSTLK